MDNRQLLGILGSIALIVGVFAPIISVPIVGSINYFSNGKGEGTIVLALGIISIILAIMNKYRGLWFTALGSLSVLLFTFVSFQLRMADARAELEAELADNPFRGLADLAMEAVQLEWGWAVLLAGIGLLAASAAMKGGAPASDKS